VSRKTVLVSEATLGFLGGMIDTLERLLADASPPIARSSKLRSISR